MSTNPEISEDGVTPVWNWNNGYSCEQSKAFRRMYHVGHMQRGDDVGLYMFTHVSELLPARRVSRAGQVMELEKAFKPELADIEATCALGTMPLHELMQNETARFRGIVVTHRGRIVFEAYPGMQENDSQVWMSTVKPVTSLLLEKLNEDGLVDYQDCIVNYFKEFEGTDWENVKLIDIVNMSTGMDLEETPETVSDPNTPVGRGFIAALPNRTDTSDRESLMDIMSEVKAVKEPGKAFEYSTFNTMILGFLIERVTGKNFADLFSEKIWSKAGMEGDGLMVVSPTGETLNGGIFSSRLRDLNRFGMLYTPSWNKVSNEQIVSDDYVRRIQEADTGDIFMKGHMGPWMVGELGERPSHNAYQWDGVFADGDMYKHGRNGQILYISPDKDVVVSIFASTLDFEFSYPAYARKIAMSLAVTD